MTTWLVLLVWGANTAQHVLPHLTRDPELTGNTHTSAVSTTLLMTRQGDHKSRWFMLHHCWIARDFQALNHLTLNCTGSRLWISCFSMNQNHESVWQNRFTWGKSVFMLIVTIFTSNIEHSQIRSSRVSLSHIIWHIPNPSHKDITICRVKYYSSSGRSHICSSLSFVLEDTQSGQQLCWEL